jgi:hypothetical protein
VLYMSIRVCSTKMSENSAQRSSTDPLFKEVRVSLTVSSSATDAFVDTVAEFTLFATPANNVHFDQCSKGVGQSSRIRLRGR